MHPPLFRPHPRCGHVVDMLVTCHEQNPLGKFWGICNDQKTDLDQCFKAEKEDARAANAQKAKEEKAKIAAHMKLIAEMQAELREN